VASSLEPEREIYGEAAREHAYSSNQRAVALAYGIACHALFVVKASRTFAPFFVERV
jgi:DNA-binding LacI/PurR family transcriptional regulator